MKKIFLPIFLALTYTSIAYGLVSNEDLMTAIKTTKSDYSGIVEIDASNPLQVSFETLLTNQKVFLSLSATQMNTSVFTLLNSDQSAKRVKSLTPPEIDIYNLDVTLDDGTLSTTCDGHDVVGTDTSCLDKNCTIVQRVISKCNDTDCWISNSSTDRLLTSNISERFSLLNEVEVSDCLINNIAGVKHTMNVTVQNESSSLLRGGSLSYVLSLQNDVYAK